MRPRRSSGSDRAAGATARMTCMRSRSPSSTGNSPPSSTPRRCSRRSWPSPRSIEEVRSMPRPPQRSKTPERTPRTASRAPPRPLVASTWHGAVPTARADAAPADVSGGLERGEDLPTDRVFGAAPLARLDQVADRELDAAVDDLGVDDRRELRVIDEILPGRGEQVLLGLRGEVFGVLEGDARENLLRQLPVAFERHEHRHLVPDVTEPAIVVRH